MFYLTVLTNATFVIEIHICVSVCKATSTNTHVTNCRLCCPQELLVEDYRNY